MSNITRTFTVTAPQVVFDQIDAAAVHAYPNNLDGSPAVAGLEHTQDAISQWLINMVTGYTNAKDAQAFADAAAAAAAQIQAQLSNVQITAS